MTWSGWAKSFSIGSLQREEYELTSDCLCGYQYRVRVTVNYGGPGVGPGIAQKWYAKLSDMFDCPYTTSLAGDAFSASASGAFRWGLTYGYTKIGHAVSEPSLEIIQGIGASAGAAWGDASVEVLEKKECDVCRRRWKR